MSVRLNSLSINWTAVLVNNQEKEGMYLVHVNALTTMISPCTIGVRGETRSLKAASLIDFKSMSFYLRRRFTYETHIHCILHSSQNVLVRRDKVDVFKPSDK